ncbi:hypothetical protein [Sphingopyxis sp.]|uniref:hypothetical protein n=1 Tax=Sphingopyxis sp. TaxID=1908224 RepID=UPI003BA91544
MFRLRLMLLTLLACCLGVAVPAQAAVTVSFYSHDFGDRFPHAFIVVKGTLDGSGQAVDNNFGFTAKNVSPAILMGSVKGYVQTSQSDYIAKSDRQFSVVVDDATYGQLIAKVREWQDRKQPSYSLNKANCVHFVMELAEVVGLRVNRKSRFFKKPKTFLLEVKELNPKLG